MIDRTDRLWERLEKLVVQWRGIGPDDEAVRTSLNFEMTEVLMDLFCSGRDDEKNAKALEDFALVWQELDRYDPSTGSFRGFVQTRHENAPHGCTAAGCRNASGNEGSGKRLGRVL